MEQKAILKISTISGGKYNYVSKEIKFNDAQKYNRNVTRFISQNTPEKIMNKYANNNIQYKGHKCGDCENLTKCEKVLDTEKKDLDKYPFITEGLQIQTMIDPLNEKHDDYYEDEFNDEDEKTDNYRTKLLRNGKENNLITVFECTNFVDDSPKDLSKSDNKKQKHL